MQESSTDETSESARRWRRWLWQTAETGQPAPGLWFDDAVYHSSDLAELMGVNAYADLVERLAAGAETRDYPAMARHMLETIFPHTCRCRRHAAKDHDSLDFTRSNVYRALYFSDESVTAHMRLLFRRTPEINLLECRACADVWLYALDQVAWERRLVLVEPEDIRRITAEGVWPDALDKYEDAWVKELGIIGRNSPLLREWQKDNNEAEAFAKFGT